MLISYPILPTPSAGDGESELDAFIRTYVDTDAGLYPVSFKDRWHGGIHLHPGDAPIRAIADGEVVAYRIAPTPETYKKQDFDTSFVLLKHTTESGESTSVVFYSLYMHLLNRRDLKDAQLKQIVDWLRKTGPSTKVNPGNSQRVWRKDILGFGGQLYGDRHVHFEIFAPDIDAFWKNSESLSQGADGSHDFFGDAGFVVPSGAHFLAEHPNAKHKGKKKDSTSYVGQQMEPVGQDGYSGAELSIITPVPIDSFLAGTGTECVKTDGRLFVTLTYKKGQRSATSYQINAQGDFEQLGEPVVQDNYEYNLYSIATVLYDDCPSAGYEMLRFGRVLSLDSTSNHQNWQFVRYDKDPQAIGYVDLAATNVTKISDADFPFWQGWQQIDESKSVIQEDGICDIPALQALLNIPADPQGQSLFKQPDFGARASDPAVARRLRHLVCKFNSEWDDSDIDKRYQRWYQQGQPLEDPASQKDFRDHVKKIAFWPSIQLPRSVWHFHPLQFIEHYRKCGWLSHDEITQLIPRNSGGTSISWDVAKNTRFQNYKNINKVWRKYGISTPERQASFIAQTYTETALLTAMEEFSKGKSKPYGPFYGRGMMQLTWASNFEEYGKFRNFPNNNGSYADLRITATSIHEWSAPVKDMHGNVIHIIKAWAPRYDPDNVANDDFNACDSAGFYWVGKHFLGNSNINREADAGLDTQNIGRINVLVNGGGNGYENRMRNTPYAYRVLSDSTETSLSQKIQYKEQSIGIQNKKTVWEEGATKTVVIDFTPQRPS